MPTKFVFRTAAAALLLAVCAVAASAQVLRVSGKVTMRQADGAEVPVPNAVVDIFRTDITQKFETKTNKNGEYTHAGIPFVGTYTLAVSAPGAAPTFLANVKLSQRPEGNDFTLSPGDGKRLTLAEVRAAGAGGGASGTNAGAPAAVSAEDKKRAAELAAERTKIEETNKKIGESNEIVSRTFKAGNEALSAGRLDEAITHYNEGIAARAEEPALLTNLSEALRRRGVDRYNAALKSPDGDAKTQGINAAKKDWSEAATHSAKALESLKTADAGTDAAAQANQAQNRLAAVSTRALAMRLVATKVDQTQAPAAWTAYQELIAAETDAAKKERWKAEALQTVYDAGALDLAMAESQKVLAANPDNVDANRILGLTLFSSGDKNKYQEAANYLQRFVDKAADTDPLKTSAKEALDYLKTAENVKPQKAPQPARSGSGRRRP